MATPQRNDEQSSGGMPRWLLLSGLGLGVLLVGAFGVWLLMGGSATLMGMMPQGVVKALGERPGEGKKVEQHLGDYPSTNANAAKETEPVKPQDLTQWQEPMQALADTADAAIDKMRASGGRDQAAVHAAEKAVDDLRTFSLRDAPNRVQQPLLELRRTMTQERASALDRARRVNKATHLVVTSAEGPKVPMRSAAKETADLLVELEDGVLVRVHLDNGNGWSRADVLSGPSTGKGGYIQNKSLKALPKAPTN